jgi:hypothetical protein
MDRKQPENMRETVIVRTLEVIELPKSEFIGNCRDRPAHLAVRRNSDWQSNLLLIADHGNLWRAKVGSG